MAPTNPPRQTTPEPDAVSDVASDVASRGSRTEIMPHYDDKGIVDSPWEIRIILIPSARDTTPPMKGTNAYLRLKSRNLILNTIIPGRDHTSFFTTVQSQLRDALQGREWIPLATYYEQATGATRLAPLPPALVDHGYTYQFLAQNCLVQHPSKPKVTIYIALRHTTLSWDQIRHLPRARPRISGLRSLPPERWWDLDDQLDLEELATHSTYALVLRPKPAAPTANDVSQTSAADSKSRSVSSCPKPAPAQGPGTAKNKHPCPYFDCPRNRLPFKQECFLFEHLEGKHKDTAWRTEVPADDGSSSTVDPLVSGVDQDTTSKTPLPDNSGDTNVASSSKPHATITPPSSVDLAASTESLQESCQLQPGDTEHSSGRDNSAEGSSYSADSGHGASSSTEGYDRTQPKRRRTSNQSGGGGNGSGDGEDDENDGGEENGAQSHTGKQQGPGKRFACPFFKHDPVKYGSDSSCRGKGWPSSHRVKEHIYRRHRAPRNKCQRCHERFETDVMLRDHASMPVACDPRSEPLNPPDGVTEEQEKLIRARRKNVSEEQKWIETYQVLFPGEEAIPSPYSEYPSQDPDPEAYQAFLARTVPEKERSTLELRLAHELRDVVLREQDKSRVIAKITDVFHKVQLDIYRQFITHHGSPAQTAAEDAAHASPSNSPDGVFSSTATADVPVLLGGDHQQGTSNGGVDPTEEFDGESYALLLNSAFEDTDIGNIDTRGGIWGMNWDGGYTLCPPAEEDREELSSAPRG